MSGGKNSSVGLPPPAPFGFATPNIPSYHPATAPPPVYTGAAPSVALSAIIRRHISLPAGSACTTFRHALPSLFLSAVFHPNPNQTPRVLLGYTNSLGISTAIYGSPAASCSHSGNIYWDCGEWGQGMDRRVWSRHDQIGIISQAGFDEMYRRAFGLKI